jgi:hypothetical protein
MAGTNIIQVSRANTPSVSTQATVMAANASRSGWHLQNQGTNPIFVLLGTGASTTIYHVVLKGGTAASDGNGAIYSQMAGVVYQGIVTTAGTGATYTLAEL